MRRYEKYMRNDCIDSKLPLFPIFSMTSFIFHRILLFKRFLAKCPQGPQGLNINPNLQLMKHKGEIPR
jgi:hypothetical protein